MVSSTDAAGTISQIARGFSSFVTRSWSEVLPVAFSFTNSLTALGVLLNTTHRCPALRSLRTMFAPILPRPIIPSCMEHSSPAALRSQLYEIEFHSIALLVSSSAGLDASTFKYVHKLTIAAGNFGHSGVPRYLSGPPANERLPESRPAHCETDKPRDSGRDNQPFAYFFVVFAAAQNDAAHFFPSAPTRGSHDFFAIFATIESLDFPDIRLDMSLLELLDGPGHQSWAKLKVVGFLVAFDAIELGFFRWYDELKQKLAATLVAMQVFRKPLQP